MLKCFFC